MASAAVQSKAVALLLFIRCLLLLPFFLRFYVRSCFIMQYFVSFLVLQSSILNETVLLSTKKPMFKLIGKEKMQF